MTTPETIALARKLTDDDWEVADAMKSDGDASDRQLDLLAYAQELAALPGTFVRSDGRVNCDMCCTGDRCDEPRHLSRGSCPHCTGGALPEPLGRAVLRVKEGGRG